MYVSIGPTGLLQVLKIDLGGLCKIVRRSYDYSECAKNSNKHPVLCSTPFLFQRNSAGLAVCHDYLVTVSSPHGQHPCACLCTPPPFSPFPSLSLSSRPPPLTLFLSLPPLPLSLPSLPPSLPPSLSLPSSSLSL